MSLNTLCRKVHGGRLLPCLPVVSATASAPPKRAAQVTAVMLPSKVLLAQLCLLLLVSFAWIQKVFWTSEPDLILPINYYQHCLRSQLQGVYHGWSCGSRKKAAFDLPASDDVARMSGKSLEHLLTDQSDWVFSKVGMVWCCFGTAPFPVVDVL